MIELRHDQLLVNGFLVAELKWKPSANASEAGAVTDALDCLEMTGEGLVDEWEEGYAEGAAHVRTAMEDFLSKSNHSEKVKETILAALEETW